MKLSLWDRIYFQFWKNLPFQNSNRHNFWTDRNFLIQFLTVCFSQQLLLTEYLVKKHFLPFQLIFNGGGGGGGGGGGIRLFWFYYGVTYNFIQNRNYCRDLHQIFSCLFETFGTMSEIMFSSDSMSKKKIFNSWKYMNVYFRLQHYCFGMVGKQWFKNVKLTGISSFTIADSN